MGISSDLVGTKVLLDVNPDDISTILAYTDDGSELGYLRASGVWGNRSHSLKTRKEAVTVSILSNLRLTAPCKIKQIVLQ